MNGDKVLGSLYYVDSIVMGLLVCFHSLVSIEDNGHGLMQVLLIVFIVVKCNFR